MHPTQRSLSTVGAVLMIPGIWSVALCLAMPMFLFRTLSHHVINLPGLRAVNFCYEDWPVDHGRAYYSVFVMLVQFCVPLLTVTVSYARIVHKLKYRMKSPCGRGNTARKEDRSRKTNILLIAIALVFCLSWLPFNLNHTIVDFLNPFGDDTDSLLAVYTVCHMLGMSSACYNPVLYGWLNDNFRKEFTEIWTLMVPRRRPLFTDNGKASIVSEKEDVPLPAQMPKISADSSSFTKAVRNSLTEPRYNADEGKSVVVSQIVSASPYQLSKADQINGTVYVAFVGKCTQV